MYRFSYWGIQVYLFVIVFWCVHWIHFLYSSLFIQVLCGYVWGWSQWLRSTEGSSRWNLPVRSRSFRSISIYLQTTQHWVCPNTHTVNSVICILTKTTPIGECIITIFQEQYCLMVWSFFDPIVVVAAFPCLLSIVKRTIKFVRWSLVVEISNCMQNFFFGVLPIVWMILS